MKKKWIWITLAVALLIAIGGIVIYKEVAGNNIERKTYEFLRTKGYNNNDIDDVDVKHSFINKILGYNEWRIFVEFEKEEDIIFAFTYRNEEIIIQGVKSENYQLTKEEIQDFENRFENGELKYKSLTSNFDFYITKPEVHNDIRFNDYYNANDRTIYTAGYIGEFYVIDNEVKMTLEDYISKSYQTFEDSIKSITDKLEKILSYDDGGTSIYKSKEKDITMIVCNTVDDNHNVFIGDYSMEFEQTMCK